MSRKEDIIRTMQNTRVNGLIAKRFFHITAPQHADSILERMHDDEVFFSFILLPNSKKQPAEALICTNQRIMIWNNEFAEDEDIPISSISKHDMESGWFSTRLHVQGDKNGHAWNWIFKCEKEIMAAFESGLRLARFGADSET